MLKTDLFRTFAVLGCTLATSMAFVAAAVAPAQPGVAHSAVATAARLIA